MDTNKQQMLREAMRPFLARRDSIAILAVVVDMGIYLGATVLAVIVEPAWQKLIFSITAGTMISTLFVLGHDAAHGALIARRWPNRILGRVLLLPSLHNYSMWLLQHNRLHHQGPNVKNQNSWSPMSATEYAKLPRWRQILEHVYRGGGFGLYYLIERWWKDKFIPLRTADREARSKAWLDFSILAIWMVVLIYALVSLGQISGHSSPLTALIYGFLIPFAVWNTNMGLTVFLQHTHREVPWFRSPEEAAANCGQEELTVHVRYPRWYGVLSHDIMEHPPHHINPRIPFYRLHAAQTRLLSVLGKDAISNDVSLGYIISLVRQCKLYDYERKRWIDFDGRETGVALPSESQFAAGTVPPSPS